MRQLKWQSLGGMGTKLTLGGGQSVSGLPQEADVDLFGCGA